MVVLILLVSLLVPMKKYNDYSAGYHALSVHLQTDKLGYFASLLQSLNLHYFLFAFPFITLISNETIFLLSVMSTLIFD